MVKMKLRQDLNATDITTTFAQKMECSHLLGETENGDKRKSLTDALPLHPPPFLEFELGNAEEVEELFVFEFWSKNGQT